MVAFVTVIKFIHKVYFQSSLKESKPRMHFYYNIPIDIYIDLYKII